ncbi:MAG: aldo/keto reductase [Actinomycetota bacterium]|jgi:aryl-alcohol dehydrogenase-like predicted oxidoreductase|nr:aldo/keto reductase [Actinomycetota bacterium]
MQQRRIGLRSVGAIGLGEMPMSLEGRPDEARSIETIHAALDAGMTLVDTADAYSVGGDDTGHGERLVAKALASWGGDRDSVLVATKGGHLRPGDGTWTVNSDPAYLRSAAEASLRRLGVEAIELYQYHRPDPKVPYEVAIGVFKELLDAGKVRMVGISNANIAQIDLARSILGEGNLVSVQNQFSPFFRSSEAELRYCGELGIAFLPWSPFGGIGNAEALRREHPGFTTVASAHGVSVHQVVLAWMLAKGDHVIPIPGASRPSSALDSAAAADLKLSKDELELLDADPRADG